jgi:hypothetical protein
MNDTLLLSGRLTLLKDLWEKGFYNMSRAKRSLTDAFPRGSSGCNGSCGSGGRNSYVVYVVGVVLGMAVDSTLGTLGVGTDVVGYALRIVVDGTAVGCT